MKAILFVAVFWFGFHVCQAQSIVGKWQLIKQTNCLEEELEDSEEDLIDLTDDLSGMSSRTPQVVNFNSNLSCNMTTQLIDHRKPVNVKSLLYKFDGENLYILDKKSRTIVATYAVDKLTADSLIYSNAARACETKIFLRLSEGKN